MDSKLEAHLIICLDQLAEGKAVEEILAAHPRETAVKLQPLLATAVQLRQLPLAHTVAGQMQSKERFLNTAAGLRRKRTAFSPGWLAGAGSLWRGFRLAAAVGLLLVLLFAGLIFRSVPNALPGDALYGTKLTLEEWQLRRSPDSAGLTAEIEAERRREVLLLLAAGRVANVTFTGQLAGSDADHWLVSDVPTMITTQTTITGPLGFGAEVRVSGQTGGGRVWAQEIVILAASPAPAPPPTPTPTSEPATATPAATPTATAATPTATAATPTATTPTATISATPAATATLQPSPTAAGNQNDNRNDNASNDNSSNDNDDDDDDNDDDDGGNDNN
jgi:hypothetical protein